jgi:hypothetical protein
MEFSYVWQILDTRFGCSAFQLTPLEQSTLDSGYSLWRTPNDASGRGAMDGEKRLAAGHMLNLAEQAKTPKLWPTPRKEGFDAQGKGHGDLQYEVKNRLWPTPTVPNGGRRNPEGTSITGQKPDGGKAQIDIREFAIRLWPTPTTRDYKDGTSCENVPVNGLLGRAVLPSKTSGSLNPRFVEELMGYEIDHTALKLSETQSSRRKSTRSLKQSPKQK